MLRTSYKVDNFVQAEFLAPSGRMSENIKDDERFRTCLERKLGREVFDSCDTTKEITFSVENVISTVAGKPVI